MDAYGLYSQIVHPWLFRISPEAGHRLARVSLRWSWPWSLLGPGPDLDPRLTTELAGIQLANPVGLAPGFDKDCDLLGSLQHLGFGFLSPGAVMRDRRPGNPHPRLGRIVEQQAVMDCMGLPSKGRAHAVHGLERFRDRRAPVFVNVQGTSPEEIVENVVAVQPYADAIELALICPNTHDTDTNAQFDTITWLLREIASVRTKPVFCKIPDQVYGDPGHQLGDLLDACIDVGIDGVIATATRTQRTNQLSIGYGTLAGKPIFADTLALVENVARHARGRLAIIGSGGVMTGRDALEMLLVGASAIQIYSALIYRGWLAPALINRELLVHLEASGVRSVSELAHITLGANELITNGVA